MDVNKIKTTPEKHRMSVHLTIRVSPSIKNWLVENNYSPTAIFHEAIKEIGYKSEDGDDSISTEIEQIEGQSQDDLTESYYVKQRVETRDGWRTKLVQQFRPKRYRHVKGNIHTQRRRWKIKHRR